MVKPKNPCSKDCHRRSATCHSECQQYKDFEKHQEQYRNEVFETKQMQQKIKEHRQRLFDKFARNKHIRRN